MLQITVTELRKKLSYYLKISQTEDILVTKNNKAISVIFSPRKGSFDRFIHFGDDLPKKSPNDKSYKELIGDAIWEHEIVNRS